MTDEIRAILNRRRPFSAEIPATDADNYIVPAEDAPEQLEQEEPIPAFLQNIESQPESQPEPQEEPEARNLESSVIDSLIGSLGGVVSQDSQTNVRPTAAVDPVASEEIQEEEPVAQDPDLNSAEASQEDYIPNNPLLNRTPSALIQAETLRFSSAAWFEKAQEQVIVLAGVGGIGSWISFLLAKLRPKVMYLYDPDVVELVNMAGQFYGQEDIGKPKVDALADTIRNYTGYGDVFTFQQRYTVECLATNIMICGFDNMNARKTFYRTWKRFVLSLPEENRSSCLFIDGRLTAEELQLFSITGTDTYYMEEYERRFLFDDSQAVNEVCSFKQTAFMANMIGALAVNIFVNFCANLTETGFPRQIPFFTQYTAETMFMSMEK